ncbi:MAG: hypothetical protein MJ075_06975, partial [Oscillospiraceae bacterium]|nr:hypothetical protein [Oscillospiraceae bacterium]
VSRVLRHAGPPLLSLLLPGLPIAAFLAFGHFGLRGDLTRLYYHSLSRIFSLLLGASFFCQRQWFETKWPDRTLSKTARLLSALVPLLLLLLLFCLIGSDSPLMPAAMPVASLLTGLALAGGQELQGPLPRVLRPLNAASYELYLLQGPVLYLLGRCSMSSPLYLPAATLVLCAAAALLWLALRTKQHSGLWARILEVLLCAFCLFGLYCWLTAPDQSREQTQMESQAQQNRRLMQQKQREEALGFKAIAAKASQLARDARQQAEAGKAAYLDAKEQRFLREAELTQELARIALQKDTLADLVLQLPITAIGDSVMLGASAELYRVFPNLYCDAEVSRTAWVVPGIVESLLARGRLADTVIIHLGTNGAPPDEVMESLFDTIGNRDIYLLTVTNDADVHVNDSLRRFAEKRDNIRIIDWEARSRDHEDYFYSDAIHLVDTGCQSYAQAIYQALYDRHELALSQEEESLRAELDALDKR